MASFTALVALGLQDTLLSVSCQTIFSRRFVSIRFGHFQPVMFTRDVFARCRFLLFANSAHPRLGILSWLYSLLTVVQFVWHAGVFSVALLVMRSRVQIPLPSHFYATTLGKWFCLWHRYNYNQFTIFDVEYVRGNLLICWLSLLLELVGN